MGKYDKCCCCSAGGVSNYVQNVTKVRPENDSGGVHYSANPFPRYNTDYWTEFAGNTCIPGQCGPWLIGGDKNGVSSQAVQDGVDDIGVTFGVDHNIYDMPAATSAGSLVPGTTYKIATVGTTDFTTIGAAANTVGTIFIASAGGSGTGTAQQQVDTRVAKLFGGQWMFVKKMFHGCLGWSSNDACAQDPNIAADQTHYLTCGIDASLYMNAPGEGGIVNEFNSTATGGVTVNPQSGILTHNLLTTQTNYVTLLDQPRVEVTNISGGAGTEWDTSGNVTETWLSGATTWMDGYCASGVYCGEIGTPTQFNTNPVSLTPLGGITLQAVVAAFNAAVIANGGTQLPAITDPQNYSGSGTILYTTRQTTLSLSWSTSATEFQWSYDENGATRSGFSPAISGENKFSGAMTLSNAYTSADFTGDIYAAANAWNLTDFTLAKLRTDGTLALAPLCCYDEVQGAISPLAGFRPVTMDDYTGYVTNDQNGNSPWTTSTNPPSPGWTYAPFNNDSQGQPYDGGSNPNWSGPADYNVTWPQRAWIDPNNYLWKYPNGSYDQSIGPQSGGFTGGATLITGLRSGSIISHNPAGYDPHFWFNFKSSLCLENDDDTTSLWDYQIGGQTPGGLPPVAQRWLDVWEACPYPADDADVGCTPTATGVSGVYPFAFWNYSAGTGVFGKYIQATQKWPAVNFGRPCGPDKYAVDQTTVCCINSGDVTSTLVIQATTNANLPLDIGGLAIGNTVAINGSGIYQITDLSYAGGGIFNCTVGAQISALPSGFSMSNGQGDDDANVVGALRWPSAPSTCGTPPPSGQTGVFLDWAFNYRAQQTAVTSPPAWYAGISGILSCSVDQFNYNGSCPTIVGIVPPGSPETWRNAVFHNSPASLPTDDVFGAHWQAAVYLTMPDPYNQTPFNPVCPPGGTEDSPAPSWNEDDGTCQGDSGIKKYFPHHPLVAALSTMPFGSSLPAGVKLYFDSSNTFSPPNWPNGIYNSGNGFTSLYTDWLFAQSACACINGSGRFGGIYATFVACT
ncbi:MAG TPA: hypothetical protein VK742_20505 [Candidatus Sulfotelmatobacter sp.]|jgi:hypothetical protein|nr:hypothetical protein [Candidatus Sulfotelmatobacter sp.]